MKPRKLFSLHPLVRGFAILAMAVAAAALAACGNKGSSGNGSSPGDGAPPPPESEINVLFLQSPYLALGSGQEQIFSLRLDRIRRLNIFRRAREVILRREPRGEWMTSLIDEIGFDPLQEIDRVVVGMYPGVKIDDPLGTAVIICTGDFSGIDREAALQGLLNFVGERYLLNPPTFVKKEIAGVTVYSSQAPTYRDTEKVVAYHFAFPSAEMMIFARNLNHMTDTLSVIEGSAAGVQRNPAWQESFRLVDLGATAWGTGAMPASVRDWIYEKVQSEPELKGLTALRDPQNFHFVLKTGNEYRLTAGFISQTIDQAMEVTRQAEEARRVIPSALRAILGEEHPKLGVWNEFLADSYVSTEFNTTKILVRRASRDVEEFVRQLRLVEATPIPRSIPGPFLSN